MGLLRIIRWTGAVFPVIGAGLLSACLHDTDIELRNDAPAFQEMDSITGILKYPDSVVGAFAVPDANGDAVRIVPSSWEGGQDWNSRGDSVVLYLPADQLGELSGRLVLADKRGARSEMPYRIVRTVSGFDTNSADRGWRPYPGRSRDAFYWDEVDSIPNEWMEFYYDPSVQPAAYADGERLGMAVGGDFSVQCDFSWVGDNWHDVTLRFLMAPEGDSAFRPQTSIGVFAFIDSSGGLVLRGDAFGKTGRTMPLTAYPDFYTARLERKASDYRILAADAKRLAEGKWDTLLTAQESPEADMGRPMYPHCRFGVSHGLTEAWALFRDFAILQGRLYR